MFIIIIIKHVYKRIPAVKGAVSFIRTDDDAGTILSYIVRFQENRDKLSHVNFM